MSDAEATTADAAQNGSSAAWSLKFDRWDVLLAVGFVIALGISSIELTTLTGLPAHPLLLHMPVIFVPLLVIAAITFAFKSQWRRRYGIAYGIGALVTMAGTGIAVGAGEALKESGDRLGNAFRAGGTALASAGPDGESSLNQHAELGGVTRVVVFALVVAILAQIAIDRGVVLALARRFGHAKMPLALALSVLTVALAGASGWFVFATGHAGAKLTFGDVSPTIARR